MKKTLFLSAILGAALCSSAFAQLTINVNAGEHVTQGAVDTGDGSASTINSLGELTITGRLFFEGNSTATFTATGDSIKSTYDGFWLQLQGDSNPASASLLAHDGQTATYTATGDIAVYKNSTLTIGTGVTLNTRGIYYSSTDTNSNGKVQLNNYAHVNLTKKSVFHDLVIGSNSSVANTAETLADTVTMSGSSTLSLTSTSASSTIKTLTVNGEGNEITANRLSVDNLTGAGALTLNSGTTMTLNGQQAAGGTLTVNSGATLNVKHTYTLAELVSATEKNAPAAGQNGWSVLTLSTATGLNGTVVNNGTLQVNGKTATLGDGNVATFDDGALKYYIHANGFGIGDARWVVSDIGTGNNANLADGKNLLKLEVRSGSMSTNGSLTVTDIDMSAGTIMKSTNLTIKGAGTVRNLQMTGKTLNFYEGSALAMYDTNTITNLDIAGSASTALDSTLTLKENASLEVLNNFWIRRNGAQLLLEKNATFTKGILTVKGLSSAEGQLTTIVRSRSGDNNTFDLNHASIDIKNAAVTVSGNGWDTDIKNSLVNSSLAYTNTDASKVLKLHGTNTLTGLTMGSGVKLIISANTTTLDGNATLNDIEVNGGTFAIAGGTTTIGGNVTGKVMLNNDADLSIGGTTIGSVACMTQGNATLTLNGTANMTAYDIIQDNEGYSPNGILKVTLDNGGHKTTVSHWMTVKSVDILNGEDLQVDNYNIAALNVQSGSSIFTSGNSGNSNIGSGNHTLGDVTINSGADLTFSNTAAATIGSLTLGNQSTLTLGSAAEGGHNYNLTTSGLTVNGDSTLNANLVVNGGTLTFANDAVLTMGCTVSIGNDVTVVLTKEMVDSIALGEWVEIIANVEGVATLGQHATFVGAPGVELERPEVYHLMQIGNKVYITPEPATATLSLLALAALAARRKRH